jgi:predicted O-methyltransferase YrrM
MEQENSMQELWTAVDSYFKDLLIGKDSALEAALRESEAAGLPMIQVTPNQGKLLWMFVRLTGACKVLEIGTLGGYSTIWMARALPPGGRLISLEVDPRHAAVARKNIARAGLTAVAEVRTGPALDSLPRIEAEGSGPFEVVFLDADKPHNPEYFSWALRLTRPGSVIIVDNVVRGGAVADPRNGNASVRATRKLFEMAAADPRISATAIQTVGKKGYDGFAVFLVVAETPRNSRGVSKERARAVQYGLMGCRDDGATKQSRSTDSKERS